MAGAIRWKGHCEELGSWSASLKIKMGMGEESLAFGQVEDELGPAAPEDLDWLVLLSVQAEALFPSFKLRIVL